MERGQRNIWGLAKDPSIKRILLQLEQRVGPGKFIILDEALDDKAVRITSDSDPGEATAYIYSYAQPEGRYGLDLEYPMLIETDLNDQTERHEALTTDQVIGLVIAHLEIRQGLQLIS